MKFGWIDRTKEPGEAADIDGMSIPWKVNYLMEQNGAVPDLFYEGDGAGARSRCFLLSALMLWRLLRLPGKLQANISVR